MLHQLVRYVLLYAIQLISVFALFLVSYVAYKSSNVKKLKELSKTNIELLEQLEIIQESLKLAIEKNEKTNLSFLDDIKGLERFIGDAVRHQIILTRDLDFLTAFIDNFPSDIIIVNEEEEIIYLSEFAIKTLVNKDINFERDWKFKKYSEIFGEEQGLINRFAMKKLENFSKYKQQEINSTGDITVVTRFSMKLEGKCYYCSYSEKI